MPIWCRGKVFTGVGLNGDTVGVLQIPYGVDPKIPKTPIYRGSPNRPMVQNFVENYANSRGHVFGKVFGKGFIHGGIVS